jgi:DNA repair protein RadC
MGQLVARESRRREGAKADLLTRRFSPKRSRLCWVGRRDGLTLRLMLQRAETPVALTGVEASRAFFAPCFHDEGGERLLVAHVDSKARCIHLASYEGEADRVDFPVRAIIGDAIRLDSVGLVLAHNHPSGEATPSRSDKVATRALAIAAEAIDLVLLDHLVFAGDHCTSFRRLGLL